MSSAGTLTIDLAAGVARLEEDMKKGVSIVERAAHQMDAAIGLAKAALLTFGVSLGIGSLKEHVKSQIELGDQLGKTSAKLGVAVEALSAYQVGARLSNVETDLLRTGMVRLASNLQEAAVDKTGAAARAFQGLGISVLDVNGKVRNTGEVFEQLSAKFAAARDGTGKTATAVALLGRSGAELIPLMNNLATLKTEAAETGSVVSAKFAAQAEQFNDSITAMQLHTANFHRALAGLMLPALTSLIEKINLATGAQTRLSLQTLERDRAALAQEYTRLQQREQMMGFTEAFVAAEKAKAIADIDVLDKLIIEENKRLAMLNGNKGGKGDGKADILPPPPDPGPYLRLMDSVRVASAKLQDDVAGDELQKIQLRVKAAGDEWRAKAREAKLSVDQQKAFESGLTQYLADLTGAEIQKREEKRDAEAKANYDSLISAKSSLDKRFAMEEQFAQRQRELDRLYKAGTIQDQIAYDNLTKQLALEKEAALGNISAQGAIQRREFMQMTTRQQTQGVLSEILTLTQGVAAHNRTMFAINKVAGIANAIMNTSVGVTKALSAYPPPLSFAMAALQLAAGLAQVQQIRAASFGDSTSAPSVSGGGAIPVTNVGGGSGLPTGVSPNAPASSEPSLTIIINGTLVGTKEFVNQVVVPQIKDAIKNKDLIMIEPNSRQALALS